MLCSKVLFHSQSDYLDSILELLNLLHIVFPLTECLLKMLPGLLALGALPVSEHHILNMLHKAWAWDMHFFNFNLWPDGNKWSIVVRCVNHAGDFTTQKACIVFISFSFSHQYYH